MCSKRIAAVLLVGVFICAGLFADEEIPVYVFQGDALNTQIKKYVNNISKLIPDSVTTQNIWSHAPRSGRGMIGFGLNASITMPETSILSQLENSAKGFGGANVDLSKFPESIPFFPAFAIDIRGGGKFFDVGLTGMWADTNAIEALSDIVGGSYYAHRTIGIDGRVGLLSDGESSFFGRAFRGGGIFIPAVVFQMGYYFTWMSLGFPANMHTDSINMEFRNDAYFFALQVSKKLLRGLLNPFLGLKLIISSTVTEYNWSSKQKVNFRDEVWEAGAKYSSGTDTRDTFTYLHLYGGLGVKYSMFDLTIGLSYNLISEHLAVSAAVRMIW